MKEAFFVYIGTKINADQLFISALITHKTLKTGEPVYLRAFPHHQLVLLRFSSKLL